MRLGVAGTGDRSGKVLGLGKECIRAGDAQRLMENVCEECV